MADLPIFSTRAQANGSVIDASVGYAKTLGLNSVADGGGAEYVLSSTDQSMPGQWSPADGRFAEIIPAPRYKTSPFGILPEDNNAAAIINDALEWMNRRHGGGMLEFLPEEYFINQTVLQQYHNVKLQGFGHHWHSNEGPASSTKFNRFDGTIFTWTGANNDGSYVLSIKPPVTGPRLYGAWLDGISIDGAGLASHGLELKSIGSGVFPWIRVADCVQRNIHIGVMASAGWTSADPRDLQHCEFGHIGSTSWVGAAINAEGIRFSGDDVADCSIVDIRHIGFICRNGVGVVIQGCDGSTIGSILGGRAIGTDTGYGVKIEGGVGTSDSPRKILIGFMQPGPTGLFVKANAVPPQDITILAYSRGNGSPAPVIEYGCRVSYTEDTGAAVRNPSGTSLTTDTIKTEVPAGNAWRQRSQMRNSAGGYSSIAGHLDTAVSNISGAESGRRYFETQQAGVYAARGYVGNGWVFGNPTGGDKGLGTLNATAVYDDNVLLTDYVFDYVMTGKVLKEDGAIAAAFVERADELLDLDTYAAFWRDNRHLPSMPSRAEWKAQGAKSVGDLIQRLWETVEIQAVHISNLHDRLGLLDGRGK